MLGWSNLILDPTLALIRSQLGFRIQVRAECGNKEWLGVFNVIGDGFKNIKGRVAGQYPTFFLKGMHNRKVVDGYAVFVILLHTIQTVFNQYIKE